VCHVYLDLMTRWPLTNWVEFQQNYTLVNYTLVNYTIVNCTHVNAFIGNFEAFNCALLIRKPGANPTMVSYVQRHEQPSVFWKQKYFLLLWKKLKPTTYNAGVVVVNLEVVGLAPAFSFIHSAGYNYLHCSYLRCVVKIP
jgi:hypothetical protein